MSYDAIYKFIKRELEGKVTIDSAILDKIEVKLKTAFTSANTADMSPRNYGRINPAFLQAHSKFSQERNMARKNSTVNKGKYISAKRRSLVDRRPEESPYKEIRRASSQVGDYATLDAEKR